MLARSRGVVQTTASSGALSPISSTARILCSGRLGLRRDLGRLRDLPHHLDDVTVRVEDVQLPVGAVAPPEDLVDAGQLLLRAEIACMRLDRLECAAHERGDGHAVAAAGVEVHDRRREPVPRGQPFVLGGQDAVEGGDLLAVVGELGVVLDERLAVGGDRDHVLEPGHRIADPDLHGAEPRVEANVPPDVRVVLDAAGLLELVHDLRVLRVVVEPWRRPGAREGGEDHVAGGAESGRLTAPERRARRERHEFREVRDQSVDDLDRLLGVVDGDMDVQPEDQLAPRDVLHLVDHRPVAVLGRDPLPLEEREGMRSGRAHSQPLLARDVRDVAPDAQELLPHSRRRVADGRRHLEHGLHQLGVDPRLELVAGDRGEHRVDVLDEIEGLAVEEHVLLLDSERVRVARAEGVVEDAAAGREARTFARDRGGDERILHAVTISPVFAGRKRLPSTTSGIPSTTEDAILPTSWPSKKWSPAVPKARTRKTTLSIGALAPAETTTRTPSWTRPRSGAPTRLSTVSETMKAARLAKTMRQVEPTTRSNSCPGTPGCEWTRIAMKPAKN